MLAVSLRSTNKFPLLAFAEPWTIESGIEMFPEQLFVKADYISSVDLTNKSSHLLECRIVEQVAITEGVERGGMPRELDALINDRLWFVDEGFRLTLYRVLIMHS